MISKIAVAASVSSLLCTNLCWAADTAIPVTQKFGYFDLKAIRNTFPDSVNYEKARGSGEDQLRNAASAANQQLKQFQAENHSAEEIQKEQKKLQSDVDTKTGSFVRQMLANNLNITEKIKKAAAAAAESNNVDLVIDANAVYFGGGKILKSGIDVTPDMIKILGTNPTE